MHENKLPGLKNGSMARAKSHPSSPVGAFLAERMPEYTDWIVAFRDQRNRVKMGANFSVSFEPEQRRVGISFGEYTTGNLASGTYEVGVREIIDAINMGSDLMGAMISHAAAIDWVPAWDESEFDAVRDGHHGESATT